MVPAKRNKVSEEGMTDSQWVVGDGGGIRKGLLEKVAFGLGHVGSVGFILSMRGGAFPAGEFA